MPRNFEVCNKPFLDGEYDRHRCFIREASEGQMQIPQFYVSYLILNLYNATWFYSVCRLTIKLQLRCFGFNTMKGGMDLMFDRQTDIRKRLYGKIEIDW